jgi:hypothetical protein
LPAAALAFLGLYAGATYYLRPWDTINPWQYHRIRLGMSEGEVEALIGLPPGSHQSFRPIGGMVSPGQWGDMVAEYGLPAEAVRQCRPNGVPSAAENGRPMRLVQWWGDRHAIRVAIDESGRVVGRYLIAVDHQHLDELQAASSRPSR